MLAVDPSSPFTGGAILGDRVRMQDHATDPGVFIRSMATRGHLGGLALATPEAIRLLDALGHRWIIVETVGVGQVEVEVAGKADTTVVVVNPGWGDSVQASKAGPDGGRRRVRHQQGRPRRRRRDPPRPRADARARRRHAPAPTIAGWQVPIVATVASSGDGVAALWDAVLAHRAHMIDSGVLEQRRRFRLGEELREIVARRLEARARELCTGARWDELTSAVLARDLDPWSAADEMLRSRSCPSATGRPARRQQGRQLVDDAVGLVAVVPPDVDDVPAALTELGPPRSHRAARPSATRCAGSDRRARARRRRPGTRRRGARRTG